MVPGLPPWSGYGQVCIPCPGALRSPRPTLLPDIHAGRGVAAKDGKEAVREGGRGMGGGEIEDC